MTMCVILHACYHAHSQIFSCEQWDGLCVKTWPAVPHQVHNLQDNIKTAWDAVNNQLWPACAWSAVRRGEFASGNLPRDFVRAASYMADIINGYMDRREEYAKLRG